MPSGLIYIPNFLSAAQEQECLAAIDELPFEPYLFGDYVAKRLVVQFGAEEYRARTYGGNQKLETMPGWLNQLRQRCADFVGLDVEEVAQSLVARYEDAGIGWHRDAPQFGPTVIGVSLGIPATMRFRRMMKDHEDLFRIELAPRSAYIMSGDARSIWQHSIPVTKGLRYSVTFRTIAAIQPDQSFGVREREIDKRHQTGAIVARLSVNCVQMVFHQNADIRVGNDSMRCRPNEDESVQLKLF
ncbi:MAG TPA: alpha-ketoglutarate-dependent dioxygenase AlkB [Oculatellaceae cyanobacterium]